MQRQAEAGAMAATSEGTPAATRSWKGQEGPSLEPLEGAWPWPAEPVWELWPPELCKNKCLLFEAPQLMAVCPGSPRIQMKSPWLLSSGQLETHLGAGKKLHFIS